MDTHNVVIIGGGAAGLSAALYLARAGLQPLVFAGSPPGGQLTLTTEVENFPGQVSILGSELIETMRKHAQKFGATIIDENVKTVTLDESVKSSFAKASADKSVELANGIVYKTKAIIVATGAKALWLGLPSETRLRGKGVSACATCDGFFFKNKVVAVVGGGDTALEEALTLTKFAKEVVLIHRKMEFKASKIMQERVKKHPHIHLFLNAEIEEIIGEQRVQGLKVKIRPSDQKLLTKSEKELEEIAPKLLQMKVQKIEGEYIFGSIVIDGVFIAIGHRPDTDLVKEKILLDKKGYVLTSAMYALHQLNQSQSVEPVKPAPTGSTGLTNFNEIYPTMTSVAGVFGAGDCVDSVYQQASVAAGMGVQAALDAEKWVEEGSI